ncbi:hypothetical protein HF908_11190 [Ralstonia pseudosolanacearum]|uniref:hypothetical protein n=1 Tax=Ralstonia pseudosolanacearum TaxID=1310165 RepID=UPI001865FFC6|nr:hypothetical protein [Ralstonia pseudosolanacearum]QOK91991.1 hypothetical protein HF908_11190 [Ralstonia pseudosolanacearum]
MTPKLFQIFRAGTFTAMSGKQMTFSEGDLHNMASAFDPQRRSAPLVLGHPESDQPEMGQAQKLLVKGGKLYVLALVGEVLDALVNSGRYKKISAAFIEPFASNNPTPKAYYLKHVGFLGAMPPSVKGMEPLRFAARDDGVCFGEPEILTTSKARQTRPMLGFQYDPERLALHRLATEYRETCPALSYAEAVLLAQDALTF